jgi:hypothetical protein
MSLAPLRWAATLMNVAHKVQALLEAQEKTARAIAKLNEELQAVRLDIERLKTREDVLIAQAEKAAAGAASTVMTHAVSDLSRRLGVIEGQLPRLPPPA